VTRLFDDTTEACDIEKAWLAFYSVLLWYERVGQCDRLPHIIDADKLKPSCSSAKERLGIWAERATKVNMFLATQFSCKPEEVEPRVDKLMKTPAYCGIQRQNPLGIAFAELVRHLLARFGSQRIEYRAEVRAEDLFPGVKLQSRSKNPRIDVVAFKSNVPVALISTKWSFRHDRLTDVIDESLSYRAAARRIGLKIPCVFVTNEFDPARLDKVLTCDVLAFVAHVCPKLVTDICGLNGRLAELKDLPYLVKQTHSW